MIPNRTIKENVDKSGNFDMFLLMQDSPSVLTKKAIEASLKGKWKEAIDLNLAILEKTPKDLDAKNRLGRAYLQIKEFNKAKRVFKEVLQVDPINSVALRNLKLATEGKIEHNGKVQVDPKNLIKEPGTTTEVGMDIIAKRISADSFTPAEQLEIKVYKNKADFYKKDSHGKDLLVAFLTNDLVNRLRLVKDKEETLNAYFVSGEGKRINVLIRSSIPVFKGEKQEVKPYIKPGSLDEPEMDIPTEFDE